jgi:hypothetical protein
MEKIKPITFWEQVFGIFEMIFKKPEKEVYHENGYHLLILENQS